jgi:hypothetical protein
MKIFEQPSTFLQRGTRQTNSWDCGPFVAADMYSLAESGQPSSFVQSNLDEWRVEMLRIVHGFDVYTPPPCTSVDASRALDSIVVE